jgi:hypothetical protein
MILASRLAEALISQGNCIEKLQQDRFPRKSRDSNQLIGEQKGQRMTPQDCLRNELKEIEGFLKGIF